MYILYSWQRPTLTGAERVVGAEELLAGGKLLALDIDALVVVDVAGRDRPVSMASQPCRIPPLLTFAS